jgi:hypothetical protein
MTDLLILLIGAAGVAFFIAYLALCDRVRS